jgi:uncharacterized repeat protein (TIGR03803 family)
VTFRKATLSFLVVFFAAAALSVSAQTFTDLVFFVGTDGANPYASLVQGPDGQFYGTATDGGNIGCGEFGCGTIFKVDSSGNLTTLHSFTGSDGWDPTSTLTLSNDGNFYGTTFGGSGTFFKMTPDGTLTTLYTFCSLPKCADGANPYSGAILATDGNFYGTTYLGGDNGWGTVFKITPTGVLTTLHSFCSTTGCPDGSNPEGPLVESASGVLYGTTPYGGRKISPAGTVFSVTATGVFTVLSKFNNGKNNPSGPFAGLIQGTDGNLYGTTQSGGSSNAGTVYNVSPAGSLSVIYNFKGGNSGYYPFAGVIEANDGNLYGTTIYPNTLGGTIFQVTPAGNWTKLKNFNDANDEPLGALVQGTDGSFYGTTYLGGARTNACYAESCGVLFSLNNGLSPFVKTVPVAGSVGTTVLILGNSLSSATSVTFNGTAASFTVVSATEITTTVPAGATTGIVQVTGSSGTLTSNLSFRVRQ